MTIEQAKEVLEKVKIATSMNATPIISNEELQSSLDMAIKSLEKLDRITFEVNWLCSVKKTEFNYKIAFDSIKKIIWDWSD